MPPCPRAPPGRRQGLRVLGGRGGSAVAVAVRPGPLGPVHPLGRAAPRRYLPGVPARWTYATHRARTRAEHLDMRPQQMEIPIGRLRSDRQLGALLSGALHTAD